VFWCCGFWDGVLWSEWNQRSKLNWKRWKGQMVPLNNVKIMWGKNRIKRKEKMQNYIYLWLLLLPFSIKCILSSAKIWLINIQTDQPVLVGRQCKNVARLLFCSPIWIISPQKHTPENCLFLLLALELQVTTLMKTLRKWDCFFIQIYDRIPRIIQRSCLKITDSSLLQFLQQPDEAQHILHTVLYSTTTLYSSTSPLSR